MVTAPLVSNIVRRAAPKILRWAPVGANAIRVSPKAMCSPQYASAAGGKAMTMVTVTQTKVSEDDANPSVAAATTTTIQSFGVPTEGTTEISDGINITASCAKRILELASKRPDAPSVYLRVYVDAGGCSGFQYKFDLESEEPSSDSSADEDHAGIDEEDDVVFEKDGARVVIDRTSLDLIKGSTVDFVREMIRSSFVVVGNPQSESACGCGSSFAIKNFESNPAID